MDMLALLDWLEKQAGRSGVILWDDSQRDLIWCYATGLIYERKFESFYCPACNKEYLPADGTVANWANGEGLVAAGGRRFICPHGHTLYACREWMS